MQINETDTATVDLATCVYLDLETTGLEPEAEVVATRTELQQMGYRPRQIAALTPVAERYNPVAHFWYPVYRVPDLEPALSRVGPAKQDPELPGTFDILR